LWLPKFLEKKVLSRQTEEEISKHTQKDAKESSHEEQSRHQELHFQQEQHNIQRKEEQENLHRQEEGRGNDLQLKEQTKQKRHHILQQEQLNLQRKEEETSMQQQQDLPRKVEVQPNIHEEKLPPESQQKQPVSPSSPSATIKYHLSRISKTPQCEATNMKRFFYKIYCIMVSYSITLLQAPSSVLYYFALTYSLHCLPQSDLKP